MSRRGKKKYQVLFQFLGVLLWNIPHSIVQENHFLPSQSLPHGQTHRASHVLVSAKLNKQHSNGQDTVTTMASKPVPDKSSLFSVCQANLSSLKSQSDASSRSDRFPLLQHTHISHIPIYSGLTGLEGPHLTQALSGLELHLLTGYSTHLLTLGLTSRQLPVC